MHVKQDRQYTYSVTLKRLRITIVAVDNQQVFHISVCVRMRARVCVCVRRMGECLRVSAIVRVCGCTGADVYFLLLPRIELRLLGSPGSSPVTLSTELSLSFSKTLLIQY